MHPSRSLSAKRDLLGSEGFLLSGNRQPQYQFNWHEHDCPMLIWVSAGSLESCWHSVVSSEDPHLDGLDPSSLTLPPFKSQLTLQPGMALLLPAAAAHANRTRTNHQQHGQLYLEPDLLRACPVQGAFYLDAPARSMLATLTMTELSAQSRAQLVRALLPQLEHGHPVPKSAPAELSVPQRLCALLSAALNEGERPPSLEDLAAVIGISMRSLQRHCLQELGCSPLQLRRRLIAKTAMNMLAKGMQFAEVSRALDFASSGHLTRLLSSVDAS